MIFINIFLSKLTSFNNYCIKDPLIFPIIANNELKITDNKFISSDKNIGKSFNNLVCNYIDDDNLKNVIKDFTKIIRNLSDDNFCELKDLADQQKNINYIKFCTIEIITFLSSLFAFGSRISIINFLLKLYKYFPPYDIVKKDIFNEIQNIIKKANINIIENIRNENRIENKNEYRNINENINEITNRNEKKFKNLYEELKAKLESDENFPYYRWINKKIVFFLILSLNLFYKNHHSIYDYCSKLIINNPGLSYLEAMICFSNKLFEIIEEQEIKSKIILNKKEKIILKNFLPQSLNSTSAKRYNLFLKWVIRQNFPDLGLWSNLDNSVFDQKNLFFPLDIHILEITSFLFKYLIEAIYFNLYKEKYYKIYENCFEITFDNFENQLNLLLMDKEKKNKSKSINNINLKEQIINKSELDNENNEIEYPIYNKVISLIYNRYENKERKENINLLLKEFFDEVVELGNNAKKLFDFSKEEKLFYFYKYLKENKRFFENSFKRSSIFLNKKEHLKVITDFYKIFEKDDPLIFDLPLSIIRSPILRKQK